MRAAMQAGVDSLTAGRTTKQSVLVQGSGAVPANARLSLPSYVILNVCGTINVTGSGSGDMAPIYARGRTDIEIPHVNITGTPVYGMFFRDVDNLRLGAIDMRVSSGLGIRIDNHGRADRANKVRNIQIDSVYVSGTGTQGVETYGVDGLRIGTVVARNVGDSGLLLNDTVNAEIGVVDAQDAGAGTGYAAFRMANRNGRINNAYPTNIRVGQVIARRGGRGIFCVSESGGAVIDRIDIADTGNNAILLENCHNVNIAAQSGTNAFFVWADAIWCRNSGAAAIRPKLANPIPLVLMKYRLSINPLKKRKAPARLFRHCLDAGERLMVSKIFRFSL
jgi:hypothetical protein